MNESLDQPWPAAAEVTRPRLRARLAAELAEAGVRLRARVGARAAAWQLATVATFAVAVVVRARHVILAGSPVNDGGMFAAMSADIQRAGYTLPAVTSYNDAAIPFAYPPLGLYLAALVEDLSPLSLLDVYWLLPLAGAVLAVGGVYALGRTLFDDRLTVLAGTLGFALAPRAFEWLVMGGGLTRGLGMAAALFALAAYRVGLRDRRGRMLAVAAVLSAATLTTHMEAAVFLATGVALSTLERPGRWALLAWAATAAAATTLAAPWWGTVLARHGLEPFLASAEHGGTLLRTGGVPSWLWHTVIDPVFTNEPFFSVVGAAGAFGAMVALAHGRWLLPAWWALIIVVHMRSFATFTVVPTALLAGYLVVQVAIPAFRAAIERAPRASTGRWRVGLVAAGILGIAFYGAVEPNRGEARFLRPVSEADQAAMAWVAATTPEDARFLVVARREWFGDREGEWFPHLAERASVGTPQGTEWIEGEFDDRLGIHYGARNCANQGASCLERLAAETGFTHVFLPAGCCRPLRDSLREDMRYVTRYIEGAAVFERVPERPLRLPPEGFPAWRSWWPRQ